MKSITSIEELKKDVAAIIDRSAFVNEHHSEILKKRICGLIDVYTTDTDWET